MKQILKKSLSVILAITIIFSSAIVGLNEVDFTGLLAVKAKGASVDDLTFELNSDGETYSVTDCVDTVEGELVIPDTYNGLSVTSIDDFAFDDCTSLVSVVLPDSITSIGDDAFFDCTSLLSINVPENNSSYSSVDGVLFNADKTSLIKYPSGKTDNSNYTIPDTVTGIVSFAVVGTCLKSIIIGDGVVYIGDYAFAGNSEIISITIPDSVTYMGLFPFMNCYQLEYVFYNGTSDDWSAINIRDIGPELRWAKIHYESTDHTPSDWIIKEATVYSAGEKHKECTQCGEILEKETIPQLKCGKTKVSKISNVSKGIRITWNKVKGADYYDVYRKTKDGSWECLGYTGTKVGYVDYKNFGVTYFTDKTAKSGTTYYYAVKVRNEAGNTDYSNSLSIKRLSVPKLSAVSNTSSGVKVSWKKVTGASGYIVYRKTKNGDWKEIGKTSKLYYTDKKAKSGTSYYYTVRAYSGSVKSYYDTDGLSIRRLVAPKISSATSKNEGILLKWNKITGASGYYVYRKASSGEWKKIATVKGNSKIKYLDESPRKGATYQYRVKSYYSKSTSANSNSYKIKCKY